MNGIENLWQYDVSNDIIAGNIGNLQREFDKGWNVNEPLLKYAKEGEYFIADRYVCNIFLQIS